MEKLANSLGKIRERLPLPNSRHPSDVPSTPFEINPSATEPVCPICRDFGWVHPLLPGGKPDWANVVPCVCRTDALAIERKERLERICALPADTEHMTFRNFSVGKNESLRLAKKYAEELATGSDNVRWLTLISQVDRGKTHLAVAICRAWLGRDRLAHYAFVPKMLQELRDGIGKEGQDSYELKLRFLCAVKLLVLDDLGVEKSSEWAQEILQTIVHERGLSGLRLVVTCNRALDDLPVDPYGRIASRLQRETWCWVVVLDAEEHRFTLTPNRNELATK